MQAPFLRSLATSGIRVPCSKAIPGPEASVSCRVLEAVSPSQGQRAAATVGCQVRLTRPGTASRQLGTTASGLGATLSEARDRARILALARLGRLLGQALLAHRKCRFTWTVRLRGPADGLLAVTSRLAGRFGPQALLKLVVQSETAEIRLRAPRCFADGRRLLEGAIPTKFQIQVNQKPGELDATLEPVATEHDEIQ